MTLLSVPIYGHSSSFARAIKMRSRKDFFAIPLEYQKVTVDHVIGVLYICISSMVSG